MVKIILFTLVIGILFTVLKGFNNDIAGLVLISGGIIIIGLGLNYLLDFFNFFNYIKNISGVDETLVMIMYKVTALGLIVEYTSEIIEDLGAKSLSNKLEFVGKIMIISVSLPVFYAIINVIKELSL